MGIRTAPIQGLKRGGSDVKVPFQTKKKCLKSPKIHKNDLLDGTPSANPGPYFSNYQKARPVSEIGQIISMEKGIILPEKGPKPPLQKREPPATHRGFSKSTTHLIEALFRTKDRTKETMGASAGTKGSMVHKCSSGEWWGGKKKKKRLKKGVGRKGVEGSDSQVQTEIKLPSQQAL